MITRLGYLPLLLASLTWATAAFAHQLDEYLQTTIVAIDPDEIRLEINLTPGVAVSGQILAVIDRDHDGVISTNEGQAYAERFKRDLSIRLDGRDLKFQLEAMNFPQPDELRSGWGIIQLEFTVRPRSLPAGEHSLIFENQHLPAMSVYLFNAAQPRSGLIQIVRQTRNKTQSVGEIVVDYNPPPTPSGTVGLVALPAALLAALVTGVWVRRRV